MANILEMLFNFIEVINSNFIKTDGWIRVCDHCRRSQGRTLRMRTVQQKMKSVSEKKNDWFSKNEGSKIRDIYTVQDTLVGTFLPIYGVR
jgi:hypothetical protein